MTAATFTRSWPSVSAWGAGLIAVALGAGAIVRPGSEAVTIGLGTGAVALGLAVLLWGGAALAIGRFVLPRTILGGSLVTLVLTGALVFADPAHTSIMGAAAASLLLVVVGATAAAHVRRMRRAEAPDRSAQPMSVIGLLVAAAVIAVVVTPALGATQNAVLLRDDGTLPVITHDGH